MCRGMNRFIKGAVRVGSPGLISVPPKIQENIDLDSPSGPYSDTSHIAPGSEVPATGTPSKAPHRFILFKRGHRQALDRLVLLVSLECRAKRRGRGFDGKLRGWQLGMKLLKRAPVAIGIVKEEMNVRVVRRGSENLPSVLAQK